MSTLDRQIVAYEQDGRIVLPESVTRSLGVESGARFEVTVEHQQIHLRPIGQPVVRKVFDESAIEELRAMLRGGPSLEDELIAARREDEARMLHKEREWL